MSNGWTEEHKTKQAQAIRRWKPWEKSTGPKTPAGKSLVSQNGTKHGITGREWLALEKSVGMLLTEIEKATQDALIEV